MLFKNLRFYRLTDDLPCSIEELTAKLSQSEFRDCGTQDIARVGWESPTASADQFVLSAGGAHLIALRRQQKILPGAAIAEALEKKIAEIERAEARKVYRTERSQLKDEITISLLPRALTRSTRTHAFLNLDQRLLVVSSASPSRAEELLTQLRNDLGSLPVEPLQVNSNPGLVMTDWVRTGELPAGLMLGDQCDMVDGREAANVVRVRGQDLRGDEVLQHIEAGKQVTKVSLAWDESLYLVMGNDLAFRRLRFSDKLIESSRGDDDALAGDQADLTLMALTVSQLLAALVPAFGG